MKYLLIALTLSLTACGTTALDKAKTIRAVLIVEQDFESAYRAVSNLDLTHDQISSIDTILSAKNALDLVLDGSNLLSRLETASLLEKHYAAAKTAYIQLRGTVDLSSLNPLQKFELDRFDMSVIILSDKISQIADSDNLKNKKLVAYDLLEMLVAALQIAELTNKEHNNGR